MWLLDQNVQKKISEFLKTQGIHSKTAVELGWEEKRNGDLVSLVASNGFTVIVTNDQKFSESANQSLKKFPTVSILILTQAQEPLTSYLQKFQQNWKVNPPKIQPGVLLYWP